MRIKITFVNNHSKTYLPINTNYHLLNLINELTYEYCCYLNSFLPESSKIRKFELYTFSQLIIPEREVMDFKIGILSKYFYWYISSPFLPFLSILAKEFRSRNFAKIEENWFGIQGVDYLNSPDFRHGEAKFTCLSPVTVFREQDAANRNGHRHVRYILPDDKAYITELKRDLMLKYNTIHKKKKRNINFNCVFDEYYIRKRNNRITKVITLEKKDQDSVQVRAVMAPIRINAEPEILRLIYDTGLGQLNYLGFGMVEMVNNNHNKAD